MVTRLFEYQLPLKNGSFRKGLVLQNGKRFGEIAPLPGFSREVFEEAKEEAINCILKQKSPKLPSVRFGFNSLKEPLRSVHLPLASLGPKDGFSTWKLKLGNLSLKEAVQLVKKCLGKASLRLDFNQKWSIDNALHFTSFFNIDDFEYLEEPVPTTDLPFFSKETGFPIALDESIHIDWRDIPSLKAIVVKPTVVGEIPEIPKHLTLVLSSSYESALGLLHIAKLASQKVAVGLDTNDAFLDQILLSPLKTEAGTFSWKHQEPLLDLTKLCPVL